MRINKKIVFCIIFLIFSFSNFAFAIKNDSNYDDIMSEIESEYSEENTKTVSDPLEPVNRVMFKINDKLYFYFFKPVAKTYSEIVPLNFRQGISRAFTNIKYPIRAVNYILEFKFVNFFKATCRLIINTALGFGGLLDPAAGIKSLKKPPKADSGLTLGKWGLGHGMYLVLPVFGPSSLRDGVGTIGDYFLNPITYVEPAYASYGIKGGEKLNYLSLHLGEYEDLKSAAMDPYIAVRNAYIQHRDSLLSNN